MADTDIKKQQTHILTLLSDYIDESCETMEKDKIDLFPSMEEIYNNNVVNIQNIAKSMAKYEYTHSMLGNKLVEIMVKKTQARQFLWKVEREVGEMQTKIFNKDLNFCIARLQDIENMVRSKLDVIDKFISSLRSIQSNAGK